MTEALLLDVKREGLPLKDPLKNFNDFLRNFFSSLGERKTSFIDQFRNNLPKINNFLVASREFLSGKSPKERIAAISSAFGIIRNEAREINSLVDLAGREPDSLSLSNTRKIELFLRRLREPNFRSTLEEIFQRKIPDRFLLSSFQVPPLPSRSHQFPHGGLEDDNETRPPSPPRRRGSWAKDFWRWLKEHNLKAVFIGAAFLDLISAFWQRDYPFPVGDFRIFPGLEIPGIRTFGEFGQKNLWGDLYTREIFSIYNSLPPEARTQHQKDLMFTIFDFETRRFSTALNKERNQKLDPDDSLIRKEGIPAFLYGSVINRNLDNYQTWTSDQKIIGMALRRAAENEGLKNGEEVKKRLLENGYNNTEAEILTIIYQLAKGEKTDKLLSSLLIDWGKREKGLDRREMLVRQRDVSINAQNILKRHRRT